MPDPQRKAAIEDALNTAADWPEHQMQLVGVLADEIERLQGELGQAIADERRRIIWRLERAELTRGECVSDAAYNLLKSVVLAGSDPAAIPIPARPDRQPVWVLLDCDESIDCDDHSRVLGVYSSPDAARDALPGAGWYESRPGSGSWLCMSGLGALIPFRLDEFTARSSSEPAVAGPIATREPIDSDSAGSDSGVADSDRSKEAARTSVPVANHRPAGRVTQPSAAES